MSLKIFLLGQFNLQADDLPVELPSRPAQSLLAYLALNAGVIHRREKLAGLLWPEATDANARGYLRQALWRIRKQSAGGAINWNDYLNISDISVAFEEYSDFWLDAQAFIKRMDDRPLEEMIQVVRLYQGELLPGFYDEWIVPERERLQSVYQQKMNLLLDNLIRCGHWEEALKWAEQWIRLGHSPEPAFRALMRAYTELGDQGMVSATYQRCLEALDRELGLGPSSKTRLLYEQIIDGAVEELPSTADRSAVVHEARPSFLDLQEPPELERAVFVAREDELRQLNHFLYQALTGQGKVIFVTGEAGSGKSALIQEFVYHALDDQPELIVAGGNCNSFTGIGDPYLPFREILAQLTGDVETRYAAGAITLEHARKLWEVLPKTAEVLTESGPDLIDTFLPGIPFLERAESCGVTDSLWLTRLRELVERKASSSIIMNPEQQDLFEQYSRVILRLTKEHPLALVIDDMQWADLGSISLLFHLGRQLTGNRLLILCAFRSEEVALGRDEARHPLQPVVHELQRQFGETTLNMDQSESRDFVEALIDNEPNRLEAAFRKMIYRQTRGHPLFTIELLRGMQERGELVQDESGFWVEGPSLDWDSVPARVEAVIAERIGRLAQPLRTELRVASVEGELFTAEVVAKVLRSEERETLDSLSRELDRRHRLIRAQSIMRLNNQLLSRYSFRHTLFQKYLYGSLDEVERVHLHEQVGYALEDLYLCQHEDASATDIAPQLAKHFQEAQITEKAVYYLHQAGERAVQLSAYKEGRAHANQGLALLSTLPDSKERAQTELGLQLTLSMALHGTIPGAEWTSAITRARELCRQTGKANQLCRVLGELSIMYYVRAEHHKARQFALEALSLAEQEGDPLLIAAGHWHLGFILFALGEFTEARAHNKQVIEFYEPYEHHRPFVILRGGDSGLSALAYEACYLWCLGYPAQAQECSQKALDIARDLDHAFTLADVLCFAGCMFNAMYGDAFALKENAEEFVDLSNEIGFPSWLGSAVGFLGEAQAELGYLQEGIDKMYEARPIRQIVNSRVHLQEMLCALAKAQIKIGHLDEARSTLMEAKALLKETAENLWEPEINRMWGELQIVLGDELVAEVSFQQAIEAAQRQLAKSWELKATISLASLWQSQGRLEEAYQQLTAIYDWFEEGFDSPDLIRARAIIDNLAENVDSSLSGR